MPEPKTIIAVDPGKQGAFVWGTSLDDAQFCKMPDTPKKCSDLILNIQTQLGNDSFRKPPKQCIAYLELITGYMGNITKKNKETGEKEEGGVSSKAMFTFGKEVMKVEMGFACHDIECRQLTPVLWMNRAGVSRLKKSLMSPTQWKSHLKDFAQEKFPDVKITKVNSDAYLIYYAVFTAEDL